MLTVGRLFDNLNATQWRIRARRCVHGVAIEAPLERSQRVGKAASIERARAQRDINRLWFNLKSRFPSLPDRFANVLVASANSFLLVSITPGPAVENRKQNVEENRK